MGAKMIVDLPALSCPFRLSICGVHSRTALNCVLYLSMPVDIAILSEASTDREPFSMAGAMLTAMQL